MDTKPTVSPKGKHAGAAQHAPQVANSSVQSAHVPANVPADASANASANAPVPNAHVSMVDGANKQRAHKPLYPTSAARTHEHLTRVHASRGGAIKAPARSAQTHAHAHHYTIVAAILAVCVVIGGGYFAFKFANPAAQSARFQANADGTEAKVTIPKGASASSIAALLKEADVIDDTTQFLKALGNHLNAAQQIKSGTYLLMRGADFDQLIDRLIQGPNAQENALSVPEGLTSARLVELIQTTYGIAPDSIKQSLQAHSYADEFPFVKDAHNDSLEGFLFPKTYDFEGKVPQTPTIVKAMLAQYQKEVSVLDFDTARKAIKEKYHVTMSNYDFLTLASIIEKEALTDDDRPLVASVFYNRLKIDKPLESDATMGYVTAGKVTADDLKKQSPYNSYLNRGLPPTPICSPGLPSMAAALNPKDTSYMYFWITEKEHVFSETYEQHQEAIKKAS